MQPFDSDWAFVHAAVDDLENYLLSEQLYWPAVAARGSAAGGNLPRLTLGNLLLSLKRLHGIAWPEAQQSDLAALDQKVDRIRSQWLTHWTKKAKQEIASRMPRWQDFLQEIRSKNPPSRQEYAYNVRLRVILGLLNQELGASPVEATALTNLDQILRTHLQPDGFVWDEALQAAFPQQPYWYLYAVPRNS